MKTLYILLPLTCLFFNAACNRRNLPDKSSQTYRDMVSAFYTGLASLQVGDDVRADEKLKQATELVPDEPAAWANWGLLALRQRNYDAAAERLEKARALAPDNSSINLLVAVLESTRGRTTEAVAQLRHTLEVDQQNLKAAYMLAEEIERQAGPNSEAEAQQLYAKILETQPDNLAVMLELTRVAAKRGDSQTLGQTIARLAAKQSAWPPEAQEQFKALQAAATGDVHAAAPRVAFLKNVLVRAAEYRTSLAAVKSTYGELGDPVTRFILLPTPDFSPAPQDEATTFKREPSAEFGSGQWTWAGAISLNGEGAPSLAAANAKEFRLANGVTLPFPGGPGGIGPDVNGVLALDFNYDWKTDLVFAGAGGVRFFQQASPEKFEDVTAKTGLKLTGYSAAWAADVDLDGDLDVVLGGRTAEGKDSPPLVARNNGDGTFKSLDNVFAGTPSPRAFAWADLDGDGDPDAAFIDSQGRLRIFANDRGGQFHERSAPQGFDSVDAVTIADVNGDGIFDLLTLAQGKVVRLSSKIEKGEWETSELADRSASLKTNGGPVWLFAADVDNNGSLDLVVSSQAAREVLLSNKEGKLSPLPATVGEAVFAVADMTGDGRLDLITLSAEERPSRFVNRGAKNYHWQIIRPRSQQATGDQRINSFGIGGEMELRAGLLLQKQPITGPLVHFGLGEQPQADVVRIVWPNGSVRAEFEVKADQAVLAEQRLKGSCPSLFAFDGQQMSFVKDCAPWSPAIGLRINSTQTLEVSQVEEWTKISGQRLKPREGYYDLRITAELWETYYLDRYELLVVDHPAGTEIVVDERTSNPAPALKFYTIQSPQPFARAMDDNQQDVSETVRRLDGSYLDTFGRGAYQGITRDHFVELELPAEAPSSGPLWLIGSGWMHPTDASVNVAISQGGQWRPQGLRLEVPDGKGGWVVARDRLGFLAGKNKTMIVDLKGVFRPGAPRRLRLRTNLEIYWDALEWATGNADAQIKEQRLPLNSAELRYRGFSEFTRASQSSPELPNYDRVVATTQIWRDLEGYYTRFGDVLPLLAETDERIVIANAGDELLMRFTEQPAPPSGWVRDYVLIGHGWIKDGDYNSLFSQTVLPLPTRDRSIYVTPPGRLEDEESYKRHPQDWQDFHTRYVAPDRFRNLLRAW